MATILQITNADNNLSLFSKAIKASDLETKLNEIGPYTLLGPVNFALRKMASLSLDQLLEPANKAKLSNFLSNYILVGKKMFYSLKNDQQLATLNGKRVAVAINNGNVHINGSKILAHDKQGTNGVIHLLDNIYRLPVV